jgi:hypothetical protein
VCECGNEGVGAYSKIRGSEGSVSFFERGKVIAWKGGTRKQ